MAAVASPGRVTTGRGALKEIASGAHGRGCAGVASGVNVARITLVRSAGSSPGRGHIYEDEHQGAWAMAQTTDETLTVLVYSDDRNTREQVTLALGRTPSAELPAIEYLECATTPAVLRALERGGVDLCVL